MIKTLNKEEWINIYDLLLRDPLRNYFNLLGLLGSKDIFKDIFIQEDNKGVESLVFLRKSGTLKLFPVGEFDIKELSEFIKELDFKKVVAPESYCIKLCELGVIKKISTVGYLAALDSKEKYAIDYDLDIRQLNVEDLREIEEIYKLTFKSYAPTEIMRSRLINSRGRAFGLFIDSNLIAVAQTDFENNSSALIVGVATLPEHQNKGNSTNLMKYLINKLLDENRSISLEYESEAVGRLYSNLGFEIVDRINYYEKVR